MSTDQEATNFTIAETAQRLGVSENAIRQRIKRHTILAVKVGGIWRVTLPDQETDHQATISTDSYTDQQTDHEGDQEATTTAVSSAARSQLEAIRDEWLQPLVNQLRDAERSIGRLEQERDQLRGEVDRLHAAAEHAAGTGEAERQNMSHTAPRPWWERLLGLTRR
jgi:excisionase family DNA binding protein